MDIVQRLILGFCMLMVAVSANAFVTKESSTQYTVDAGGAAYTGTGPSANAACAAALLLAGAPGDVPVVVGSSCFYKRGGGGNNFLAIISSVTSQTCPINSGEDVQNSQQCICSAGSQQVRNACVTNETDACTAAVVTASQLGGSRDATSPGDVSSGIACMTITSNPAIPTGRGCTVNFQRDMLASPGTPNARSDGTFSSIIGTDGFQTSASCQLAQATKVVSKNPCPNGYPGEVNGATVCVPKSTTEPATSTTTGTSTSQVSGKTQTVVTTVETNCSGAGSCTTITNTSTTLGTGTPTVTSSSKTEPKAELCARQPTNAQCKTGGAGGDGNGGSFAGTCTGEPTCTGDALQCAIAKATFQTKCALKPLQTDTENASYVAGAAAIAGELPASNPRSNKTEKTIEAFDRQNPFSNNAMMDSQIQLGGSLPPVTIPWSAYNGILVMMGRLLVGVTLLTSAFLVVKGV